MLDQQVFEFFQHHQTWLLTFFFLNVTALGSGPVVALVTALACGFLATEKRYRTAIALAVCLLVNTSFVEIAKYHIDRQRPPCHPCWATGPSMPSGHTAAAFCCYLALCIALPKRHLSIGTRIYRVSAAMGIGLLVGVSRLYLGAHWFSDVHMGAVLGMLSALFLSFYLPPESRRFT